MIKLIVNNQELSIVTQKVVSGTHNFLTVEAEFKGSAWDGLRKWVHFTMGQFNYIIPMLDDKITADQHLDLTEGSWEVYVHGNLSNDEAVTERVTTDIKYLYVEAPFDGHPFPPLTPDFEELLANQVAEAREIAEDLRRDAEAGFYADGATFFPEVDDQGIISWTNDKGRENPEPRSVRGPQGPVGDSGVYIGTEEPTDPDINVWINPDGGAGKLIISSSSTGTHAPGTTDTYTLGFSDGTSLVITVYNGADGSGAGDMVKAVYDSGNKQMDIFDYADSTIDKTTVTGLLKGLSGAIVQAVAGTDYLVPANLEAVAFSGEYSDIKNPPTIPAALTVDSALSNSSKNPVQNKVVKQAIDGITTRPNPYSLTIDVNGSAVTYDGSSAKSISIDTSGSGSGSGGTIKRSLNFPSNQTFAVNELKTYSMDVSYAGYTPIGIGGIVPPSNDSYWTIPAGWYLSGNTFAGKFGNLSGSSLTTTFKGQIQVIYQKD